MTTDAPSQDYRADDSQLPQGAVARWNANLEAIRLLKRLQELGLPANRAQQQVLGQYSGFGDTAFEHGFRSYTREKNLAGTGRRTAQPADLGGVRSG